MNSFIFDKGQITIEVEPETVPMSMSSSRPNERCYCCGRHISELEPFGKDGDPLESDIAGPYLVETIRALGPLDEEALEAIHEAQRNFSKDGFDHPHEWLTDRFGRERAEQIIQSVEAWATFSNFYLCRDCIILKEDQYFEKLRRCRERNKELVIN